MAEVAFNKNETLHQQTGLQFKDEINEMLKQRQSFL
jgi:hypothetical protein